jgi:acetoin utilization deacetylase AcuC-like enzyme
MFNVAWSPLYNHPLPPNHRFPMAKYDLLPEQLLYEGTLTKEQIFTPAQAYPDDILRVHSAEYLDSLLNGSISYKEMRAIGFPYSNQLIEREITIMGGTIEAAISALENGIAFNIAGGTHHAFTDRGEGFCLLNDNAIAAAYLLANRLAKKILIIDLDVHQGNGTAAIFKDVPEVFTFSMHGRNNYPHRKEVSDLDVELEDGTEDLIYLEILKENVDGLIQSVRPDFIFYQSGVDVLKTDKLGRLGLSLEGCRERDKLVLNAAYQNGIPMTASMGGGYSADVRIVVEAHANLYREATKLY